MTLDSIPYHQLLESGEDIYQMVSVGQGPSGSLPLTTEMLQDWSSGDLFGLTQNAGMGWPLTEMLGPEFLLLSTQGGVRSADGSPVALGFHTGHWEVGLLVQAAAKELKALKGVPFAAMVSDPCDGRTQGTAGMFDSLPYRNDAALVMRRLIRSLPNRQGVFAAATCDKGLPAALLAICGAKHLPGIIAPGGVTLPAKDAEDLGKVQTLGARYAHGEITLEHAADMGCRACGSPGGGCQFLGTAASSQVIAESLGLTLPHAALAPSGQPIWLDNARRSARALWQLVRDKRCTADIVTRASIRNAMVIHAASGGSTNLLLHVPAMAHAAGLPLPTLEEWEHINRITPRIVDVLPNGPVGHPTIRLFLAGGVPEIMLHARDLGLLDLSVLTVTGRTLGENLAWWEKCERRVRLKELLWKLDGVSADSVIMSPHAARSAGLTSTVCFPKGNIAPQGSVIKSTAIDPSVVDADGVYRREGPARVFYTESDAVLAIKGRGAVTIKPGDVLVLAGRGPAGAGMEEIYQITSALKHLSWGKHVAVVTDARFSGVSTGACIGHVGPEALAGGPLGKLRSGDLIRIEIDRNRLVGSLNMVGENGVPCSPEEGAEILRLREAPSELRPDPRLPDDTKLWAALTRVSGGAWRGCVYDVDRILEVLAAGERALAQSDCSVSKRTHPGLLEKGADLLEKTGKGSEGQ